MIDHLQSYNHSLPDKKCVICCECDNALMVGMTTEGEDTDMLKYVVYNCLSSPRRIVGVPHDCPALNARCPSNESL